MKGVPGILRRLVAFVTLAGIIAAFYVPAWGVSVGWLARVQLVPAILAGNLLVLALVALSVLLCGRLYCSVVCPLGIAQDFVRFCLSWIPLARPARPSRGFRVVRLSVLVLFVLGAVFGFTGLIEPYGIFGRFLAVGIRRVGEPAVLTVLWAVGFFAVILLASLFRARWWCNRLCPVGTFLGLFSRFALFRPRVDADACVGCGLCAKACDKGAIVRNGDGTVSVDASQCVSCFGCASVCRTGALRWRGL